MLALLSRFVRWLRLDGVRALKQTGHDSTFAEQCFSRKRKRSACPYGRPVPGFPLIDGYTPFERCIKVYGHEGEHNFQPQSANAETSQPVSTPQESANK
jgi:hypothetical protein